MKVIEQKTITVEVELTGAQIFQLVMESSEFQNPLAAISPVDSAKVIFEVPSGGDYSGMALDMLEMEDLTIKIIAQKTTAFCPNRAN